MTLNFFSEKPKERGSNKYHALLTVRTFIMGRPHLPKDFVEALHTLIPELQKGDEN